MIEYEGNITKLIKAKEIANEILMDENFYQKIIEKQSFDMATCPPQIVADYIKTHRQTLCCNVKTYKKRFSRALAYYTPSRPTDININTAKINRTTGSIVATFIHEYIHMIDDIIEENYFGHGDNKRAGKLNTAPYWIDNLSQSIVTGVTNFKNSESSNIVYKRSFFSRIRRLFK